MPLAEYTSSNAIDPSNAADTSVLRGKSVVITGGASGLGLAYVRAFVSHGAFVTFGDINAEAGESVVSSLGGSSKVQFVRCDVVSWADQAALFKAAVTNSPSKSCDIVVANAGIARSDSVFNFDDDSEEPVEPDLAVFKINGVGPLYTAKLAMHYFSRQPDTAERDRCLIIKGSLAAYLDLPGAPQYNASKFAMRGFVDCIRRTGWQRGIRVNLIAPWFIATPIMDRAAIDHLTGKGIVFATEADAAAAVLHVACDRTVNGRSVGVVPREDAEFGFVDLRHDDFEENDVMRRWQDLVLKTSHRVKPEAEQPPNVGPEGFGSK